MATQGFSSHQLDDAAVKGNIRDAFVATLEEGTPTWKSYGFEEDSTTSPFDEFSHFSDIGLASRREEFQQIAIDVPKQGYTLRIYQTTFAVAVPVSEEALRFLKRGKMNIKQFLKPAQLAAKAVLQTNETLAADVFGNAFDTNFTGMDGQPMVSTSHKLIRGGTASNHLGTVSFSQTSLETALIQGYRFPSDSGLPVGVQNGKRILVLPPEYWFESKRILKSALQSNTANNAINTLKDENLEPVQSRYLPSQSNWFMVNTGEKDGLHAIFETEPTMKEFGDDKVHAMYFESYEMVAFQAGLNWRRVQGSNI